MFRAPRGTTDILPGEQRYWRWFEAIAQQVASRFGYERIDTPIFEDTRLFVRGIGEVTDIVEKETYTFDDRGGDPLTLRPEGTAPVCRAYIQHGMHNLPQPVRLHYICPIFRYERPQSGRYRQHHQFGIEVLGDADASIDAEVVELGWRLLEEMGLGELSLSINSIGDAQCRPAYIERLQKHHRQHEERLCSDCKRRLASNPLRLLDCKQVSCQPVIATAPHSVDHLCDDCAHHFAGLLEYLEATGISSTVDNKLVRGFDYYTRTVFEIVPPEGGRQSTIVGGGRYDGLIEELGGSPTPGVGFGMGIERVLENLKRQGASPPGRATTRVAIAHLGAAAKVEGVKMASSLRRQGITAVLAPSGRSLKAQLKYASAQNATHAIIIGDEELQKGAVVLRDMTSSQQSEVSPDKLPEALGAR